MEDEILKRWRERETKHLIGVPFRWRSMYSGLILVIRNETFLLSLDTMFIWEIAYGTVLGMRKSSDQELGGSRSASDAKLGDQPTHSRGKISLLHLEKNIPCIRMVWWLVQQTLGQHKQLWIDQQQFPQQQQKKQNLLMQLASSKYSYK